MNGLATDITVAAVGVGLLSARVADRRVPLGPAHRTPEAGRHRDLIASPRPRPRHLWTGEPFTDPRDLYDLTPPCPGTPPTATGRTTTVHDDDPGIATRDRYARAELGEAGRCGLPAAPANATDGSGLAVPCAKVNSVT